MASVHLQVKPFHLKHACETFLLQFVSSISRPLTRFSIRIQSAFKIHLASSVLVLRQYHKRMHRMQVQIPASGQSVPEPVMMSTAPLI